MIEDYKFGEIKIDGKIYHHDLYLDALGRIKKWWRKESHLVEADDLKDFLSSQPEIVIIGTGFYGIVEVRPEIKNLLKEKGVSLEIMPTREAINRFNKLAEAKKNIVGFFHLTC